MGNSDPIDELLGSPIPEQLWHYTSVQAFHGIVTSRKMFATDIRFLNDREEFSHARTIAIEFIENMSAGNIAIGFKHHLRNTVDLAFNNGPLHRNRSQVFVASFTSAEDQLSQWRAYSHGSSGVSLALRLVAVREQTDAYGAPSFAPCVYDLGEKRALIEHALRDTIKEIEGYSKDLVELLTGNANMVLKDPAKLEEVFANDPRTSGFQNRLDAAMDKTSTDLMRIAALLKNPSLREEQEWRLGLPPGVRQTVKTLLAVRW